MTININVTCLMKKTSSYIGQYPTLRVAQGALHFTSLADLFNQTASQLLWEAYKMIMTKDVQYKTSDIIPISNVYFKVSK